MTKPFWAVALLGITGGAGILIASSGGEGEAAVQQQATLIATASASSTVGATPASSNEACDPAPRLPPGTKLWRWGDVAIATDESSGVEAVYEFNQNGTPVIRVFSDTGDRADVLIDATTGIVLEDNQPSDDAWQAEVRNSIVATYVCPFDSAGLPWPFNGEPPTDKRFDWGNISVIQPDPASGVQISFGGGSCFDAAQSCKSVLVQTARSSMAIDANTGKAFNDSAKIASVDSDAFARYLESIQVRTQ
ncbi:MAG: hypothetical protein E6I03_07970 [Chloroflexi bacterium]|nr:MAG: hypothetical protein E6I03_07970 [Chloroflexota bacterium]